MNKIVIYTCLLFSMALLGLGCKDESNYPGGTISPYIPIYDLRSLYKGTDVQLNADNMYGSTKITGVVVSDHSEGNMPAGLLVLQDKRRLGQLRGISIPLGNAAKEYSSGDSVVVDVEGGSLKRVDGLLQITNIRPEDVTRVSSGNFIAPNRVGSSSIIADPDKYESTLVAIVKGGFNPLLQPGDVLAGDKVLNDGFGDIVLHTATGASFAKQENLPFNGNYYGIIFMAKKGDGTYIPEHRIRKASDIVVLGSSAEISPVIISGFISDPKGTDANNEYIQFMATRDIDFAVTPFSVVTTNNAGASNPTGNPAKGWATGGLRTYKFNIRSGKASKGTFFYVGGTNKLINSTGSTDISGSNWVSTRNYGTTDGEDFGTKTTNLLANSGNAFGIAVFAGTTVTANSQPIDVIFVGAGGSLFSEGPPPVGYRIANTDFYDVINPITLSQQPFYRQGSNTINLLYNTPSDAGYFYKLGGVYNASLGKWMQARTQTNILLTKTSTLQEIEGEGATALK
ncbi:MAG: DUF5689 domain-containing protein [Arcticibacter sp.]